MARARLGETFEVRLPSGRSLEVRTRAVEDPPADLPEALARGAVELFEEPAQGRVDAEALPLSDANVIETLAAAIGAIASPSVPLRCRNCAEEVELSAAPALPLGPLLVPLDDPELDPPRHRAPSEEWHDLPRAVPVARKGDATRFLLATRTLGDRVRLQQILGHDHDHDREAPLPFGAPLIRAIGVAALGNAEGPITTSAIAVARALDALDDEPFDAAYDAISRAWDEQHYPPRLLAAVPCPRCGARHDLPLVPRPLDALGPRAAAIGTFPSLEEFRETARGITEELLAGQSPEDVDGLEIVVDDGVPPCDDGGEPLLGCYTPNIGSEGVAGVPSSSPFTIELYYRTFATMFEEEAYDVAAEIRETIEHELEHHVNFLDGDDPLDREERLEIERERARRTGPRGPGVLASELGSGAVWLLRDFRHFLRVTWPLIAIALVALVVWLALQR